MKEVMTPSAPAPPQSLPPRVPTRGLAILQLGALAAAGVAVALSGPWDRWDLPTLAILVVFAIASELASVYSGQSRIQVSGSGIGQLLAAVLLGGGPAAVVGVLCVGGGWLRSREAPHMFRNNLAVFAWYPLVAGLFFSAVARATGIHGHPLAYYLLVFVTYLVGLAVNLLGAAGFVCYLTRESLPAKIRATLAPLLSAELLSALLSMGAVALALKFGAAGLIPLGLAFVILQYLVSELLTSKRRSQELQRIATTDQLTGLANRERFREVVEERIVVARGAGAPFAVMLMDLDRFKEINDGLGHHYGDVLLRDLGPRLQATIGEWGVVARLGGDEFGIVLAENTDATILLEHEAERLLACVAQPCVVDELALEIGASVGIARYPRDGTDAQALMRCADIAMYTAKEAQTGCEIFTEEQSQESVRRINVLTDIRRALADHELVVHFQPIVELDDFTVRSAEGLVRWQHPELGLIPPGEFVSTIEQSGLIGPLTRYVLEQSLAECSAWRRDGHLVSVAVNLAERNLLDRDLPKDIERMLEAHSLPAQALTLELTERMIMSDPERSMNAVARLSDLGVQLSVDDFGTGYSSLANLRRLPINELKIDRSFVSPMLVDESALIIVRSTINLAHDLGMYITAEGVEDDDTLQRLALLGCDLAQGYFLSRPLAPSAFRAWLAAESIEGAPAVSANSEGGVGVDSAPGHRRSVVRLAAAPEI
jgi:diguanylate cyclase (GGDEF)-like protein